MRRRRPGTKLAVAIPEHAASIEPDGRRKIEGSLEVPPIPPAGIPSGMSPLEGVIDIRIRFKGGFEREEERPLLVQE